MATECNMSPWTGWKLDPGLEGRRYRKDIIEMTDETGGKLATGLHQCQIQGCG